MVWHSEVYILRKKRGSDFKDDGGVSFNLDWDNLSDMRVVVGQSIIYTRAADIYFVLIIEHLIIS